MSRRGTGRAPSAHQRKISTWIRRRPLRFFKLQNCCKEIIIQTTRDRELYTLLVWSCKKGSLDVSSRGRSPTQRHRVLFHSAGGWGLIKGVYLWTSSTCRLADGFVGAVTSQVVFVAMLMLSLCCRWFQDVWIYDLLYLLMFVDIVKKTMLRGAFRAVKAF